MEIEYLLVAQDNTMCGCDENGNPTEEERAVMERQTHQIKQDMEYLDKTVMFPMANGAAARKNKHKTYESMKMLSWTTKEENRDGNQVHSGKFWRTFQNQWQVGSNALTRWIREAARRVRGS